MHSISSPREHVLRAKCPRQARSRFTLIHLHSQSGIDAILEFATIFFSSAFQPSFINSAHNWELLIWRSTAFATQLPFKYVRHTPTHPKLAERFCNGLNATEMKGKNYESFHQSWRGRKFSSSSIHLLSGGRGNAVFAQPENRTGPKPSYRCL